MPEDTALGELFLMGFEGTTVTPQIKTMIEHHRVGALILDATNFSSAEQATCLIRELQGIARKSHHRYPLLIAVDQENGMVNSITDPDYLAQFPSSLGVAATGSVDNAYQVALATARELSSLGVNWILGPSLDVILDKRAPGFGSRSFGDDPKEVAELGKAYIRAFRDAGVASSAKHFPLGGSLKFDESSTTVPLVSRTLEQLRDRILVPFQQAIQQEVDAIMACGCAISSIGPKMMHACFSKKVVTDLLRDQLNYNGVVVSECLEMESIASHIGVGQATVMGIHAGCDLLTICRSPSSQSEALAALSMALQNGALSHDLIQKSAERVMKLRSAYTSWSHALNPPGPKHLSILHPTHAALANRVYEESITLIKDDEGSVPLSKALSSDSIILIFTPIVRRYSPAQSDRHEHRQYTGNGHIQYGEDYFQNFGLLLAKSGLGEVLHTSYTSHGMKDEHERLIQQADAIIVFICDTNRNQYQLAFAKHVSTLCRLHQNTSMDNGHKKRLIVVSVGYPHDLPPGSPFPTHLCTYDCSSVALQCLSRTLTGEVKAPGQVPGTRRESVIRLKTNKAHQQAWLVEDYDTVRDKAPFEQFIRSVAQADDASTVAQWGSLTSWTPAHASTPQEGDIRSRYFVVRNTSTGSICGFASVHYFSELRRGCLGAIMVEPSKRRLSVAKDLHTSALRSLAKEPGIRRVQLGAPIYGLFPGCDVPNNARQNGSAIFFEKMGWEMDYGNATCRRYSYTIKPTDIGTTQSTWLEEAQSMGIILERCDATKFGPTIVDFAQRFSASDDYFSTAIYRHITSRPDPPQVVLARDAVSSQILGSLILVSPKSHLAQSFPITLTLPENAMALLWPIHNQQAGLFFSSNVLLQSLFVYTVSELSSFRIDSCTAYGISANIEPAVLEEIGFRQERSYLVPEMEMAAFGSTEAP